jgi:hypothetical protein
LKTFCPTRAKPYPLFLVPFVKLLQPFESSDLTGKAGKKRIVSMRFFLLGKGIFLPNFRL